MGHYYNGMLDIASDTTLQCSTFGGHIEIVEVDELALLRRDVTEKAVAERVARRQADGQVCSSQVWGSHSDPIVPDRAAGDRRGSSIPRKDAAHVTFHPRPRQPR